MTSIFAKLEALTTRDAGRKSATDAEQLEYAAVNGYVILTHNRVDFEKLPIERFNDSLTHSGIIISVQRSPKEIVRNILAVFNHYTANEMKDQVVYI